MAVWDIILEIVFLKKLLRNSVEAETLVAALLNLDPLTIKRNFNGGHLVSIREVKNDKSELDSRV